MSDFKPGDWDIEHSLWFSNLQLAYAVTMLFCALYGLVTRKTYSFFEFFYQMNRDTHGYV